MPTIQELEVLNEDIVRVEPQCLPHELTMLHSIDAFSRVFPKWDWNQDESTFNISFNFDPCPVLNSYASISPEDWLEGIRFFSSLKWKTDPDALTAFVELAFHAHYADFNFSCKSPAKLATLLRKICNQCMKMNVDIFPGVVCSKSKCRGKPLPAGRIVGADFLWPNPARQQLAIYAVRSKTHALTAWGREFP